MSTSLTGKRSSGAQARTKCQSTFVNKAERRFCSSPVIIRGPQPAPHSPRQQQSSHNCPSPSPPKQSHAHANPPPPLPRCLALTQLPPAHPHRVQNLKIAHFAPSFQLLFPTPASSELGLQHLAPTHSLSPVPPKPAAWCPRTPTPAGTRSPAVATALPASAWRSLSGKRNGSNPPGASPSAPSPADTRAAPPRLPSLLITATRNSPPRNGAVSELGRMTLL